MGSCRACCSEPRVGRGARAARVGTPRAPGPGRVQVRPPPELPPAPAPAPAPARAPRSAAAWGGSERSEQRAREGGGTEEGGRELESELWSRAGEEREGAAAKPGWGSFLQRTGAKIEERPSSCPAPRGQREWQRGADEERTRAGAPALPPCTTQRPSGSQAPASLKPAQPAVFPECVHPFAWDCLWPHAYACERVCSHVLTGDHCTLPRGPTHARRQTEGPPSGHGCLQDSLRRVRS